MVSKDNIMKLPEPKLLLHSWTTETIIVHLVFVHFIHWSFMEISFECFSLLFFIPY